MACNCLDTTPQQIVEFHNQQNAYKKNPVLEASFRDVVYPLDVESGQMSKALKTDVKLKIEGRKTPKTTHMTFSYCPFCGTAYREAPAVRISLTEDEATTIIDDLRAINVSVGNVCGDNEEINALLQKIEAQVSRQLSS